MQRLRWLVYGCWALLLGHPARADSVACTPLIPANSSKPAIIAHGQGLLFKLVHNGQPPNFLFGTMHVGDAAVTHLPKEVTEILDASKSFTMEAKLDEAAQQASTDRMFYHDGKLLEDVIGKPLFQRTAKLLGQAGIPADMAATLKPWAAYMTLNMPPEQGTPLDLVLMQRAAKRNLPVYGLETVQEQLDVLDGLSMADQLILLRDTVCHFDILQKAISEMKTAYLQRDMAALVAISEQYQPEDKNHYARVKSALLSKRNSRMLERMAERLQEGNAFIAVGALHLPGEDGLLALLEQRGYTVTTMY